jgi:hypothetical protein
MSTPLFQEDHISQVPALQLLLTGEVRVKA